MQSKDTKLNQALTRACKPVITTYCSQFQNEEIDHGDVMECLLRNKVSRIFTFKCLISGPIFCGKLDFPSNKERYLGHSRDDVQV